MAERDGFIAKHGLWTEEQRRQGQEIKRRLKKDGLQFVRVVWSDTHGAARAKTMTVPGFLGALQDGCATTVATTTLDASGARTFSSFVRGGGMGLEEMTGSPNIVIVPDPGTFRVLPWAPETGWVLGDEYFTSGAPFHFSPRQLLRRKLAALAKRGLGSVIGLEVEWYLLRIADEYLTDEHIGRPGIKGRPLRTHPAEPGYSLHSESNFDLIEPIVSRLGTMLEQLGLPLRSIEKEWGPGQLECTFAPRTALEAADNYVLFRSATRQICRRAGYLASFMTVPGLPGYYASGWHLHQSLVDAKTGRNLFAPETNGDVLSALGRHYLGGLVTHGLASAVFANPSVNGYRRFRPNSLAPDRVSWGADHRGTMLRVLGGYRDRASRIENRVGEPWANPYLYILAQLAGGFDGIDRKLDPGVPDTDPYAMDRPMLPKSLPAALGLMQSEPLFKAELGGIYLDYYVRLKQTEIGRFEAFLKERGFDGAPPEVTEWEQNEYFDFF